MSFGWLQPCTSFLLPLLNHVQRIFGLLDIGCLDPLHVWTLPWARNAVVTARHAFERLLEDLREEEHRGTDGRSPCKQARGWQRLTETSCHYHGLVIVVPRKSRTTDHADFRGGTLQQQIPCIGIARLEREVAVDAVEGKTLVGQVGEIKRQASRQCRDTQQPEYTACAWLNIEQLSVLHFYFHGAVQAPQERRTRRARPTHIGLEQAMLGCQARAVAQILQGLLQICALEFQFQGAALACRWVGPGSVRGKLVACGLSRE